MFQSLFFWMALWKVAGNEVGTVTELFQSLFFWMALWKSGTPYQWPSNQRVSILVFLDGALKDITTKSGIHFSGSFNPCFSGWRSERDSIRLIDHYLKCFNPCFSGWRSERQRNQLKLKRSKCFNPCFSGWRSESVTPCLLAKHRNSFNPCFSGWRSESFSL